MVIREMIVVFLKMWGNSLFAVLAVRSDSEIRGAMGLASLL
ncbi:MULTISPECIES: hypothetical protein [Bartonella]|nr:hypothetical protein [Bartonella grahamii]